MNKVVLMGRLTRNPDVRYSQGENATAVARFTLAVDRRFSEGADFISCVAFRKTAEFAEKYLKQGTKVCLEGRIQTGEYTKENGEKRYTTDVVVENIEFAESKKSETSDVQNPTSETTPVADAGGDFLNLPQDDELPFA